MNNYVEVSVVMPAYNVEKYIAEAIESILNQTFTNLKLIIVDDNSTDKTFDIICQYAQKDKRIVYSQNQSNKGIAVTRNVLLELATNTKYIALLDSDDIALPNRIEKQVNFMNANEHVGVCGTWFELFDDSENTTTLLSPPCDDKDIKIKMLADSAIGNSTAMIRKSVLDTNNIKYNEEFRVAQDYELWSRLIPLTNFYNLPEKLVLYRWYSQNVSSKRKNEQIENANKIRRLQLSRLGLTNEKVAQNVWNFLFSAGQYFEEAKTADEVCNLLESIVILKENSTTKKIYDTNAINELFKVKVKNHLINYIPKNYNFKLLVFYLKNDFKIFANMNLKQKSIFIIKCLINWKTRI